MTRFQIALLVSSGGGSAISGLAGRLMKRGIGSGLRTNMHGFCMLLVAVFCVSMQDAVARQLSP